MKSKFIEFSLTLRDLGLNLTIDNALIEKKVKFPGVTIDENINFKIHVKNLCKRFSKS